METIKALGFSGILGMSDTSLLVSDFGVLICSNNKPGCRRCLNVEQLSKDACGNQGFGCSHVEPRNHEHDSRLLLAVKITHNFLFREPINLI